MKKLLSMFLVALMVIAAFPVAVSQDVTAVDSERTAYLDPTGDDKTAALGDSTKPFATFKAAYNKLCPEGGTIVFTAPYNVEQTSITGLLVHYGEIVITANGDYDNYWFMASYLKDRAYYTQFSVKFGGPVTIENIALVQAGKTAAAPAAPSEYIFANFNPLTIGEGVKCYSSTPIENADTAVAPTVDPASIKEITAATSTDISINGGALNVNHSGSEIGDSTSASYNDRLNQMKRDTCVTVNSGVWRAVAGGSRHDTSTYSTVYNGNYRVYINGGIIESVIGANWGTTDVDFAGGQAYIYMTGGTVNNLYPGSNQISYAPLRNSVFVWVGGIIKTDIAVRNKADTFILYGGNVRFAAKGDKGADGKAITSGYSGAPNIVLTSGTDKRMLACDGQSCAIRPRDGSSVAILPIASTEAQVVYVDQANGTSNGTGTESNPVNSYQVALAMFNLVGGKIVLKGDYTFKNNDTTSLFFFREPDHKPVVIDGGGHKVTNVVSSTEKLTLSGVDYTVSAGFDNYVLSGETTFQNIDFAFVNEMNFSADFNHLTMGENIVVSSETLVRLLGANYYPVSREGNGNSYNANFRPHYADYSAADTHITVKSGDFWVTAFSRVRHGDKVLPYAGQGVVDIFGGTISTLYGAPVNNELATAESAILNISGGTVGELYMGGYLQNEGTLKSVTINVTGDAVVKKFNGLDNCTGTATYNISTDYATYIEVKELFKDAEDVIVNTSIEHLAITFDAFDVGFTDEDKDSLKLRARYSIDEMFFDNEDYNIVEMGVLVKLASVADKVTYIKGANGYYYAPVTIGGEASTENYSGNIAKSVSYVQNAEDATKSAVANYIYDGSSPVGFTAPIVDIAKANGETEFVFVPYVVVHNADKTDYQVFYGEAKAASVKGVAQDILDDANSSEASKTIAQAVVDFIG